MTKRQDQILKMLSDGATSQEIIKKLRTTDEIIKKEISELKRQGYHIVRRFYYDGTQNYKLEKSVPNGITPILGIDENGNFRALATSDTHIGSKKENLKYLDIAYNYAAQNGIHIIFNAGDLIEGMAGFPNQTTFYEQIEYFLEKFPYRENILTFAVLGNHDEEFIKSTAQDLSSLINQNRNDLISLGYGVNTIGVCAETIAICHIRSRVRNHPANLVLAGHSHKQKLENNFQKLIISSGTLSDDKKQGYQPGFIDMAIDMKDGYFYKGTFISYIIHQKQIIKVSDTVHHFKSPEDPKGKQLTLSKFH